MYLHTAFSSPKIFQASVVNFLVELGTGRLAGLPEQRQWSFAARIASKITQFLDAIAEDTAA